ncbi:hypothetical protein [Solitalea canadensis]|uniref:DUF4377 domain-containing protein n=1 Tax=Solitalea canadensis (strain ATCC 29591 / DSM 3403 / JCM 21819 / LMG 8368 / NBRC 15130 / NCIMB 12057 / USAM 9D) TaxID=929556 RepID=H8KP41_SOLCM|nr:hypothetical protein [Solitalea canadensis]AFD05678.1 hypothetical protein Solca_0548 [Solitalea canadensis DSM 3403]
MTHLFSRTVMYTLVFIIGVIVNSGCATAQKNYKMSDAEIKMIVISRGSYQYLVRIGETTYFPKNLSEEFKQDGLKVHLTYKVLELKEKVYKPSPTDVPEVDYEVNVIEIKEMKLK